MYGLVNMSLFLLLVNFIAALVAVQLLRGDFGADQTMNFGQLFTAFLAVYQVFSSENWPNVLYGATQAERFLGQTIIVALFISLWMLFANCESCCLFANGTLNFGSSHCSADVHCCH
jgi:voltage-dependent calcium channel